MAEKRPFILFVSSGGARMQEGMLSLMQMPRVTIAVDMLREAGLPYIVVLTDPTLAASAPPTPCWATCILPSRARTSVLPAQRVIAQTMREQLPEGFQRAEYLLEHGMMDMVVHRHDMRATLSRVVHLLMKRPRPRKCACIAAGGQRNVNAYARAGSKADERVSERRPEATPFWNGC